MSRKRSGVKFRLVGSPPGPNIARRTENYVLIDDSVPRHCPGHRAHAEQRRALVHSEVVHGAARDRPGATGEDEPVFAGSERRPGTDPGKSALVSLGFDINPVFGAYAPLTC